MNSASRGLWALLIASLLGIIGGIAAIFIMAGSLLVALPQLKNMSYVESIGTNATALLSSQRFFGAFMAAVRSVVLAALVVGVIIGALQIYGWMNLRSYSRERYSTPYFGSALFVVGVVVEMISLYFLLAYLSPIINEALSGVQVTPTGSLAAYVGAYALATLLGAIVMLVGEIMMLIGLWRAGSDFNSVLLKVYIAMIVATVLAELISYMAAIVLGVVGEILLVVGLYLAYRHSKEMEGQAPPA